MKNLFLTAFSIMLLASTLTACHTLSGVGQDVQAGGRAISRAAN